MSTNVVPA